MQIAITGLSSIGLSNSMLLPQHHEVVDVAIIPEKVVMLSNHQSPIINTKIEHFLTKKN